MNFSRFIAGLASLTTAAALAPVRLAAADAPPARITAEFHETDELFASPGMGWQTFHQFADRDKNLQGLPSASAYFRFYWREIEPQDGAINFAKLDDLLAGARRAGQKLAFRVMTTGSREYADAPAWLKEQGCRGIEFTFEGRPHWVPDFEDPLFQKAHFRLIRELGARYDAHPDLDLVDIGSVGLWGEWHMSGTRVASTGKPVPMPSTQIQQKIVDAWCRAFPKTAKVVLIGSEVGMRGAAQEGYGWRADCLGDLGGFSKNWNHMDNFYVQQIERTGAGNAWKRGPVAFESCWDMRKWQQEGWNIGGIYDYALRLHTSYVNNKSAPLPDGTRAEVERFLRRIGYRLVLRRATYDATGRPGETMAVRLEWENVGVAPPYRDYRVALRLSPANSPEQGGLVSVSDIAIRGWLPGRTNMEATIQLPSAAARGACILAVALVDPLTKEPAVRLAIPGRRSDGWYPVGELSVR